MGSELSELLENLACDLLNQFGFNVQTKRSDRSFGDLYVVFVKDDINLRFIKDRGQWNIEFMENSCPKQWYDTSLLFEFIRGTIENDVIDIDSQVDFIRENLPIIMKLMTGEISKKTHTKLAELRRRRFERRIPELVRPKKRLSD